MSWTSLFRPVNNANNVNISRLSYGVITPYRGALCEQNANEHMSSSVPSPCNGLWLHDNSQRHWRSSRHTDATRLADSGHVQGVAGPT
jgi:hypothetical protein